MLTIKYFISILTDTVYPHVPPQTIGRISRVLTSNWLAPTMHIPPAVIQVSTYRKNCYIPQPHRHDPNQTTTAILNTLAATSLTTPPRGYPPHVTAAASGETTRALEFFIWRVTQATSPGHLHTRQQRTTAHVCLFYINRVVSDLCCLPFSRSICLNDCSFVCLTRSL